MAMQLEILNPHEYDAYITFDENKHEYKYKLGRNSDWIVSHTSATGFKKEVVPDFDREKVLEDTWILKWAKKVPGMPEYNRKTVTHLTRYPHKNQKYKNEEGEGLLRKEVIEKWANTGKHGSRMHLLIELYLDKVDIDWAIEASEEERFNKIMQGNTEDIRLYSDVISQFTRFETEFYREGWRPYRLEWKVFDPSLRLSGTIDALFYRYIDEECTEKEFCIVDWKRTPRDLNEGVRDEPTMFFPLEHVRNTNLQGYNLQVRTYGIMLERYAVKVNKFIIVQLRPGMGKTDYNVYDDMDNITDEVRNMMELRKARFQFLDLNDRWAKHGLFHEMLPATGRPLWQNKENEYRSVEESKREREEEEEMGSPSKEARTSDEFEVEET